MSRPDTAMGAEGEGFPPTVWSLVARLRDPRDPRVREHLDRLIRSYWKPVYRFVRVGWKRSNEDAKDLTQAFFVHILEGELLARADPEKGNFRHLLLTALRNFLSNEARAAEAVKRGGGRKVFSFDAIEDDDDRSGEPAAPEERFDAQWAREVLDRAMERLKAGCRPEVFETFRKFHLDGASVRKIAADLGQPESQVAHHLQDARALLRRLITDMIREYVDDDAEVARELDSLFRGMR